MRSAAVRTATLIIALTVCPPFIAAAAGKPFTGPAGWDHTVTATPTPQVPRAQESWKKSDGEQLTLLTDDELSYDDTVAMIHKNITGNGLKPAVDKDRTCDSRRAHEVEMTLGSTVVHQIVVDDAPGVTKLTYTRTQGTPMNPDIAGALTTYCGP